MHQDSHFWENVDAFSCVNCLCELVRILTFKMVAKHDTAGVISSAGVGSFRIFSPTTTDDDRLPMLTVGHHVGNLHYVSLRDNASGVMFGDHLEGKNSNQFTQAIHTTKSVNIFPKMAILVHFWQPKIVKQRKHGS
jgi:hypothetical protein